MTNDPQSQRWESEVSFFDRQAETEQLPVPISAVTIARYQPPFRRRFATEYRFHVLGDLTKKRILDVGCGSGLNSVLLARLGAQVTGLDISPQSIRAAIARARVNGVEDRTDFVCSPLELATF